MEILHIAAECYPVAKAGGLGDVVGALPKYQNKAGHIAKVVMPMYKTKFLYQNSFEIDFKGVAYLGDWRFEFTVIKEQTNVLGFDLYLVDINGLLDREKIYGYDDDSNRFTAFQIAVLTWLNTRQHKPNIVHCHDHHTGLVPFMMQHCYQFKNNLAAIKTIFTIHNAQYQGWMGWDKSKWLPHWDSWKQGLLDWKNTINPLASAVKCAFKVTTVSPSYMNELTSSSNGLETLFAIEKGKCVGILNGIDNEVWNPETDSYLTTNFGVTTITLGKQKNKDILCSKFGLNSNVPLFVFIGRLVEEKAADLLPQTIQNILETHKGQCSFLILGSGDPVLENQFRAMVGNYGNNYNAFIGYNETLSHAMYAAADFLLMPSRIEPCGLNQMYAMRYGTMPIVRSTGGLQDSVIDMGDWQGFGIRFTNASVGDIYYSITRAIEIYKNKENFAIMQNLMMQLDHSWQSTVEQYNEVYY
jgi:starch synthase